MLLQRSVFSERLSASSNHTFELFLAFVTSLMPPQPRGRDETLVTSFPLTNIVSDFRVR